MIWLDKKLMCLIVTAPFSKECEWIYIHSMFEKESVVS